MEKPTNNEDKLTTESVNTISLPTAVKWARKWRKEEGKESIAQIVINS